MRNFQNFSVIQILREINFGHSRSYKTAVLAILGALNFAYLVNFSLHKVQKFLKINIGESRSSKTATFAIFEAMKSAKVHENPNFSASNCVRVADFALRKSQNLISRKI